MLEELRIAHLGVIDASVFEPGPGLTVVTGETGAGKTMVVSGLGLIVGGRADARIVRNGSGRAVVEARFSHTGDTITSAVAEAGGSLDDGELILTRSVTAAGRSRSTVGGVSVPAALASRIGGELVTIHGQSEQIRLGTQERQREVLDRAAGPDLAAILGQYQRDYAERRTLAGQLAQLIDEAASRTREADMLRFGLDEIAAVDPQPGEDTELNDEARRLQAVDDLRLAARTALVAVAGDDDAVQDEVTALGLLAAARKALESGAVSDRRLEALAAQARELTAVAGDLAVQTASYLADLDADPTRLEWIAERRAALAHLTRRYGPDVDAVLAWGAQAVTRLTARVADLTASVDALADRITEHRRRAADDLAGRVGGELAALAMPHAVLRFDLTPLTEPGPSGRDAVTLLFSANPGLDPAPLGRVASGGELSRVRLALEVTLAEAGLDQTFVFDEVDAGVGGAVALEIGSRLARLARTSQVIVVTHLAQVAAYADRHVVVTKSATGEVTTSDLRILTAPERRDELARMMGGLAGTASSLAHAAELLATAAERSQAHG